MKKIILLIILVIVISSAVIYFISFRPLVEYQYQIDDNDLNKTLSCEKLHEKILSEANKLERSCINDNDCLAIGGHACGDCINKTADTAEYFSDIKKLRVMEVEAFEKKMDAIFQRIPAQSLRGVNA